jgi:hypothetical protein
MLSVSRRVSSVGALQHCRRPVDADEMNAGIRERPGYPAGAAPELEHLATSTLRKTRPERDVPAPERPRVLPVVKRCVLVPPEPAFAGHATDSTRVRANPAAHASNKPRRH